MKFADLNVPDKLKQRLLKFRRHLLMLETLDAVAVALAVTLAAVVILWCSDRFWNTPVLLRLTLTAIPIISLAVVAIIWTKRWVLEGRSPPVLARMIQKRFRPLGDRLQGIVELADPNTQHNDSDELRQAAINQVSHQACELHFGKALHKRQTMKRLAKCLGLIIVLILLILVDVHAVLNAARRWAMPVADIPRYTFTQVEQLPAKAVVARNEPFQIRLKLDHDSRWRPATVQYRFGTREPRKALINQLNATLNVGGVESSGRLHVRIGDLRRDVEIKPVYRPSLTKLQLVKAWPEYLNKQAETVEVAGTSFDVLKGTSIRLKGTISRKLTKVTANGELNCQVNARGTHFLTDWFQLPDSRKITLNWRDIHGLTPAKPLVIEAREVMDEPPTIQVRGMAGAVAMHYRELLALKFIANDDFGVKDIAVDLGVTKRKSSDADNSQLPDAWQIHDDHVIAEGKPDQKQLNSFIDFSPELLSIPGGTTVTLVAKTADFRPEAARTVSREFKIYILTDVEHLNLLKQRFRDTATALEDVIREERDLIGKLENTLNKASKKLNNKANRKDVQSNSDREATNANELQRLAENLQKLLEEAMKNPACDAEELRRWAEQVDTMKKAAQNDMQTNVAQLQQQLAAQKMDKESLEDVNKARKELLKRLGGLWKEMGDTVESIEIRNFIARLKQLGSRQAAIRDRLKDHFDVLAGKKTETLHGEQKELVTTMAKQQKRIRNSANTVRDDITGFQKRVRDKVYLKIMDEMAEMDMDKQLKQLHKTVSQNRIFISIPKAKSWSEQFFEWAEMLEKMLEEQKQKKQGEGNPPEMSEEKLAFIMDLIRILGGEQRLRDKTRLLDQKKDELQDKYLMKSLELAKEQLELETILQHANQLLWDNPEIAGNKEKELIAFLDRIKVCMQDVGTRLSKPDTGNDTIAAETEIIELISAALSNAGQGGSGAGNAAALAMMAKMGISMGAGKGAGGGSNAGDDQPPQTGPVQGSGAGENEKAKTGERSVEQRLSDVPQEFRDMMESYYMRLEDN